MKRTDITEIEKQQIIKNYFFDKLPYDTISNRTNISRDLIAQICFKYKYQGQENYIANLTITDFSIVCDNKNIDKYNNRVVVHSGILVNALPHWY